jgi:hypothetical protein
VAAVVKEYGSTLEVVSNDLDVFVDRLKAQELAVEA